MGTEKCERCDGTGVVFTTSLLGRGDKDTCPECEGKCVVPLRTNPSEIVPETPQPVEGEQVDLAQQSWVEREAAKDLGILNNYHRDTEAAEIAEYWIERCLAAESRALVCQFCREEFAVGTPEDELTQHVLTCEKSPAANEIETLRAEVADLKSREVIEYDSIYYAPLAITNGTWEWFDASDGGSCPGVYVGGESVPRELYVALPGVNLDKFCMAYPTREAAMAALRAAIQAMQGKGKETP